MSLPRWWKWAAGAAALLALLFVGSCGARHVRDWLASRRPPIERQGPVVDLGALNQALLGVATTVRGVELAVPQLTEAQRQLAAARTGLELATADHEVALERLAAARAAAVDAGGQVDQGSESSADQVTGDPPEPGYPLLLTSEDFIEPVGGRQLTVDAWAVCRGCRLDLRGVWGPEPERKAEGRSWLGNVGRVEWALALGGLAAAVRDEDGTTRTLLEPSLLAGWRFRSWRAGRATLDLRGTGIFSEHVQLGHAGLGISWGKD